ncbi:MAG: YebC/PmpR family DNA-binding transcriptional regulator [Bacteroidetes bacterium]|nr:YebC/PmpR family DNA-binding transcriptional regulator [Bacteroidota bacterium]
MAGHSKWANIKHRKGANDAKRGKLYTKLIKEITVAVKEKGDDQNINSKLRLAIQNAKGANVPKDTIERAIKKASGSDSANYIAVTYEGYASGGIAIFVECMTDNINRTVSSVRSIFSKYNGNLGKNGSISHLFERKGTFIINKADIPDIDDFTLEIIDAGASEIESDDENFYIICPLNELGNIQKQLEILNIEPISSELSYFPNSTISLDDNAVQRVFKLVDALEENNDVQKVYHNLEVKPEQEKYFN